MLILDRMRNETNGKNIGPILPACCFVDSTVLWIFFPFLFTINIFQMTKKKKKKKIHSFTHFHLLEHKYFLWVLMLCFLNFYQVSFEECWVLSWKFIGHELCPSHQMFRCSVTQSNGPGHSIVTMTCDSDISHLNKFYSAQYLSQHGLTPKATRLELLGH